MHAEFDHIVAKIKEAREAGDVKAERRWKNKLAQWQREYGAYAPVR